MADKEKDEDVKTQPEKQTSAETKKPEKLTIPKDRFDTVNEERKTALARVKELEAAEKKAEQEALAEQGKFEELYKAQLEAVEVANAKLAKVEHDSLKRKIATDAGFPGIWDRLHGEGEEDLTADMALFMESMPKPSSPNIDAGTTSGKRTSDGETPGKVTKENRNYVASILNVPASSLSDEAVRGVIDNL